jgi:hypothetical protein
MDHAIALHGMRRGFFCVEDSGAHARFRMIERCPTCYPKTSKAIYRGLGEFKCIRCDGLWVSQADWWTDKTVEPPRPLVRCDGCGSTHGARNLHNCNSPYWLRRSREYRAFAENGRKE